MNLRIVFSLSSALAAASMVACSDDSTSCDPAAQTGCSGAQVCEEVSGGEPACFDPLVVRGHVFDLADDGAIEGARVVPLDENGAPAGSVAVSDAEGAYELRLPAIRSADGTPLGAHLTLRADAATFQTFPSGIRQALPIDTASAVAADGKLVVSSSLTEIGLFALEAGAGTATLTGTVDLPEGLTGVLVVAEVDGAGFTAVPDRSGDFTIFNLPAGAYTVSAYAQGASWAPADVTLAADERASVELALDDRALGQVDGTIQVVNGGGGAITSVLLVVESTFDENLARGAAPPGLRVGDVSSAYQFTGVPAGHYVVLAAFENDGLVRDPDLSIGGTSILHIEVVDGQTTSVEGFKVTGALEVFAPGADAPEAITGTPSFTWADDSSEDLYELAVLDAFGQTVWQTTMDGVSGGDCEMAYGGPALAAGMYYQFRVTSVKDGVPIARTEDLRGVFYLP